MPPDARVAVLVKPAFRALWEARYIRRRIGWPTDHRRIGLTDVVPTRPVHRVLQMGDLGVPLGVEVRDLPRLPVEPGPDLGVILLPLSASGRTVEWQGYRGLADALAQTGQPVRFAAGPGESDRLARIAGPHPMLPVLPLDALARCLAGARAVVGNDSGLTHLAAAARRGAKRPVSGVVGIAGSTSPDLTGAPGATWLSGPRLACGPCYAKRCPSKVECLDVAVDTVLHAVLREVCA